MSKIIRSKEVPFSSVTEYERDVLEALVSRLSGLGEDVLLGTSEILSQARDEAEQKVREAYAEGLRRGTEAGREKFLDEVGEAGRALRSAADAIRKANADFLDKVAPQVVQLAMAVAVRILRREANIDPAIVLTTVREALSRMAEREHPVARVNPQDLDALREHKASLLEEFDGLRHIDVVPDESITPGGCIVESATLHLDARFEAQVQHVLDALTEPSPHDA